MTKHFVLGIVFAASTCFAQAPAVSDPNLAQIVAAATVVDADMTAKSAQIANQNAQIADLKAQVEALKNAPPPPPEPRIGISMFDQLQTLSGTTESTGWKQPTNAGDTGGPDPSKPSGTFTLVPGPIATFSAAGAYPYNNGYWYVKFPGNTQWSRFVYEFEYQFPTSADLNASTAIEFELQQSDGSIHNMAWQFLKPATTPSWRYFDKINRRWVGTTLSASKPLPGQWVKVSAEFIRNADGSLTHKSLTIDGVRQEVNITQPAQQVLNSNYLSVGFQLDSNGANPPTKYSVKVRNMRITVAG